MSWKIELPQLLLIVAMFVAAAVVWHSTPQRIAIHWGLSGQPDYYVGKLKGLLGVPFITLLVYLGFLFNASQGYMDLFLNAAYTLALRVTVLVALAAIYGCILLWSRGIRVDPMPAVLIPAGITFVGSVSIAFIATRR